MTPIRERDTHPVVVVLARRKNAFCGCAVVVVVASADRIAGLAIHRQNGVFRKGRRDVKEEQESSLEGIFQTLRLCPRATRQPITMFRLVVSKNSGLDPLHPSSCRWFRVGEALQMQQSMNQIKAQLVIHRRVMSFGLALRCFAANENLAVLEGDDVGRTCDLHEATMQLADPAI